MSFKLRNSDKATVMAFLQKKPEEGYVLKTDGRSLYKEGLTGDKIAVWRGKRIAVVSNEASRSDQIIIRYLLKVADKKAVTFSYEREGHSLSLRFETGVDSMYAGQDDGWVLAFVPEQKRPVGRLDWSQYRGKYSVKNVEVSPKYRRSGIATEMYREWFKQEGISKRDLEEVSRTDAGEAFRSHARMASSVASRYKKANKVKR